jgi:hypothetical protein
VSSVFITNNICNCFQYIVGVSLFLINILLLLLQEIICRRIYENNFDNVEDNVLLCSINSKCCNLIDENIKI